MMYLKENNGQSLLKYTDFLKQQTKVQIDGEQSGFRIETTEGIYDTHPKMTQLEIGNTDIKEVDGLKNLRVIDTIMLYDNKYLRNINGLNIECSTFLISGSESFSNIGEANIKTKHFIIRDCPKFDNNFKNIDTPYIDITDSGTLKDLSFLKDSSINRIDLHKQNIESLYGVQFVKDLKVNFYGDCGDHNFMYHSMFYEKNEGKITDYWKQIVDYWMTQASSGTNEEGFDILYNAGDLKEVIFDGIKLPAEEITRLFTPEQQNVLRSMHTVKKFNL